MKQTDLKTLCFAALALVLLAPWTRAADLAGGAPEVERRPVAVVSLASYDDLMARLDMLGKISRHADIVKNLEGVIALKTQGQGLKGLDKARPSGVLVTTDGHDVEIVAFLPVVDLKQMLQSISPVIGLADSLPGDVLAVSIGDQRAYLKQQGEWAFVGQSADALSGSFPSNPGQMLGGLDKQYLVSMRIFMQSIPRHFRDMAVDQLRASIDDLPEKDESPSAAFRRKLAEQQVAVVIKGINEVDQITLGLSLDPVAQSASVDVSMTAVAGSELSRRMVTLQKTETQFGGFLVPSAAASFNVSSELSQQAVTDTKAQLEIAHERLDKMIEADGKLAAPADKTAAKEIVTELLSAVTATLAAGKIDGAASVVGHDSQWTLVSALHSADPKKVEDALKKFVELERRSRPNFPAPEWDVETVGDVRFHKLSVPLTAAKRSAALLGDHLDLVIGVGPGAVYCAAGADALSTLKKSLSGSGTSQQAPPMQLTLALAALAKAVDSTGQGAVVSIMAMGLQSAQGKDHLSLTVRPIASGVLYRVEVQEGLLGVGASMGLGLFGIPAGL